MVEGREGDEGVKNECTEGSKNFLAQIDDEKHGWPIGVSRKEQGGGWHRWSKSGKRPSEENWKPLELLCSSSRASGDPGWIYQSIVTLDIIGRYVCLILNFLRI